MSEYKTIFPYASATLVCAILFVTSFCTDHIPANNRLASADGANKIVFADFARPGKLSLQNSMDDALQPVVPTAGFILGYLRPWVRGQMGHAGGGVALGTCDHAARPA